MNGGRNCFAQSKNSCSERVKQQRFSLASIARQDHLPVLLHSAERQAFCRCTRHQNDKNNVGEWSQTRVKTSRNPALSRNALTFMGRISGRALFILSIA